MIKNNCYEALAISKLIFSIDWCADGTVLLDLYRSLIGSKLDWGCIVYGSTIYSFIKMFDTIHHQGWLLLLETFRTSPVESLYVEANEPSLENRRIKRGMPHWTTLTANATNHTTVFLILYMKMFMTKTNPDTIQSFGLRRLLSPSTPVPSTNKTYQHDKTEILLKVALCTITIPWCYRIYKSVLSHSILQLGMPLFLAITAKVHVYTEKLHGFLNWLSILVSCIINTYSLIKLRYLLYNICTRHDIAEILLISR